MSSSDTQNWICLVGILMLLAWALRGLDGLLGMAAFVGAFFLAAWFGGPDGSDGPSEFRGGRPSDMYDGTGDSGG
jgi:hypothetical protein